VGWIRKHCSVCYLSTVLLHLCLVSTVLHLIVLSNCISDYAAKVFGFHTFGKVYGLIICLAGLFNFLQTPLDALTHKTFNNNPVPVNLILLGIAMIVGLSLTIFVWRKSHFLSKEELNDEAVESTEHLIPEVDIQTRDYGTL
jgi:multisubunit Na+/H+ antiporter MnhC subunit